MCVCVFIKIPVKNPEYAYVCMLYIHNETQAHDHNSAVTYVLERNHLHKQYIYMKLNMFFIYFLYIDYNHDRMKYYGCKGW